MKALLVRLAGVTAHYRDPRINTAKIGLPARTLRCPPPCTIHGLLCAAKGGWVDPSTLAIGWRSDAETIGIDFQTSRLPQRKEYNWSRGTQKVNVSPVEREFMAFPVFTILALSGVEAEWFRRPANPLSLGRSEDLIIEKEWQEVTVDTASEGTIAHQCLPCGMGAGTLYAAPLYFEKGRRPVGMAPRTDAFNVQDVRSLRSSDDFARLVGRSEAFYIWRFDNATG